MPAIEKRAAKKIFFIFSKSRYFVMCVPFDINVGVFCETSVGLLEIGVSEHFTKYSQSYVNLNVKGRPKFNCL